MKQIQYNKKTWKMFDSHTDTSMKLIFKYIDQNL